MRHFFDVTRDADGRMVCDRLTIPVRRVATCRRGEPPHWTREREGLPARVVSRLARAMETGEVGVFGFQKEGFADP